MNNEGQLYIIAAPSGAGKTSLVRELIARLDYVTLSISHTTRAPRPSDVAGVDYFFVAPDEFEQMVADDQFLEYAEVFDHSYGTSKHWVNEQLANGQDVLLEIDWQGARQIKQVYPRAISIFVVPPSYQELQARIEGRNEDSEEVMKARMSAAGEEMAHFHEFDYIVVNDDFDQALQDLLHIFCSSRLRQVVQLRELSELLAQWSKNH